MKQFRLHRQGTCGQAMVWFMATIAATMAVLYGVYNVGQVSSAKQKVVNATDAGALAGATQQARLLNLMAYGNRAMVVSDAMAGQLVSLDSWMRYLQTTTQNVSHVSRLIPWVGQVLGTVLQTISRTLNRVEDGFGDRVLPAAIRGLERLKGLVSVVNESISRVGNGLASQAASAVVASNQTVLGTPARTDQAPQQINLALSGASFIQNQLAWTNFSKRYSGADRGRAKQVVLDSMDQFSTGTERSWQRGSGTWGPRLEKRGGTRLVGFDRWEAQDALDFRLPLGWFGVLKIPVGWGRTDLGVGGNLRWGGTNAQTLAFGSLRNVHANWSGVSEIRDLSDAARTEPELSFLLITAKPGSATPTTGSMGIAAQVSPSVMGSAQMNDHLRSDQVSAISTAKVYFERPQRGLGDWTADAWRGNSTLFREDAYKEYASLYNPFWQARLSALDPSAKGAILLAMGWSAEAAEALDGLLP
jgi:hypothetical protein